MAGAFAFAGRVPGPRISPLTGPFPRPHGISGWTAPILSIKICHAMLTRSSVSACVEHSALLKVTIIPKIPNYEPFNLSIVHIHYRSWNYRGCWHQTCPPIAYQVCWLHTLHRRVPENMLHPPKAIHRHYLAHTEHTVICAPAALLGCGSHLSGSLSGTEPSFSVTRRHHGSPLRYQQS